jgi:hypothetical protein
MFFHDDEKEGKEEALEKLKDLMMGEMGDRMGRFKKPIAASMTIEKVPKEEMEGAFDSDDKEGMGETDSDEDGDISDEDKDRIRELFHKYC